jgi:hypothetical protein
MIEMKYKSILRKLNEYLLYPSSISFYGYGGSTAPVIDDPSARAYRKWLRGIVGSTPRYFFHPGEPKGPIVEREDFRINVKIHEDKTHPWHIDHVMSIPGVKGSTFFHERYDKEGNIMEGRKILDNIAECFKRSQEEFQKQQEEFQKQQKKQQEDLKKLMEILL